MNEKDEKVFERDDVELLQAILNVLLIALMVVTVIAQVIAFNIVLHVILCSVCVAIIVSLLVTDIILQEGNGAVAHALGLIIWVANLIVSLLCNM